MGVVDESKDSQTDLPTDERSDIRRHMKFLGFSENDDDVIARIHEAIDDQVNTIIAEFYEHLNKFSELDNLLTRPGIVAHLKHVQRKHLLELGLHMTWPHYTENLVKIGSTHEKIGLKQEWYLGAHSKLFDLMSRALFKDGLLSDEESLETLLTLNRLFALDATVSIEAYYQATKQRLEALLLELSKAQQDLEETARIDEMTGVSNRSCLFELLEAEISRSQRFEHPFSLLFLDIDRFKKINDGYGHIFGDSVIRATAQITREFVRPANIVGRYGGEEFAIGLVECDSANAFGVAERLREKLESTEIAHNNQRTKITVSIGVAELAGTNDTLEKLIHRADTALYQAKDEGRNRTVRFEA